MPFRQTQKIQQLQYHSEEILVVRNKLLFQNIEPWNGIKNDLFDQFASVIAQNAIFIPRAHAEINFFYKQIIPYMIFKFEQKIFVMQRKSTASEQRLANKYSIGIGGHVRQEDIANNDIFSWAKREFKEEVSYQGTFKCSKFGVLNEESSDVGKVHLGMVFLLEGNSDQIDIKDEHQNGFLLTFQECQALYPLMENWSQIVFDQLKIKK